MKNGEDNTLFQNKYKVHLQAFDIHSVQNFLYLLPYYQYIPNKSFIFVTRFPPISVMELVESGFISYWSKSVLSLAHEN